MPDLNLDPATVNPDYIVSDQRSIIFNTAVLNGGQKVTLDRAAHMASVVVNKVLEEGGVELLALGTDYVFNESDKDYDAMSLAELADLEDSFSGILLKSITVIKNELSNFQISIAYTTLEVDPLTYAPGGEGPEPTPGLMADLIDRITDLEVAFNPVTNITTELLTPIRCLAVDYTGTNADNWITEERHSVNTTHSEQVIRPGCGAFYRHDISVTIEATGVTLVEGTDYFVFGVDVPKTKAAHHSSGVYDYICLTKRSLVGVVKINYHAYGGSFSDADAYEMKKVLANILRFLAGLGFGEGGASICACLGDIKSLHTLTATDEQYHWVTIAKLYKDASNELVRRSVGTFRVVGDANLNLNVMFGVDVDLDRADIPIKFDLISGSNPSNWEEGNHDESITEQIIPRIRVIWDSAVDAGMYLQIGLPVRDESHTAALLVENHSTTASAWNLIDGTTVALGEQDDAVVLPDSETVWTDALDEQCVGVLGYKDGIVLFSGYATLDESNGAIAGQIFGPLLSADVPVWALKRLTCTFYDRYTNQNITQDFVLTPIDDDTVTTVYTENFFYTSDLCSLRLCISNLLIGAGLVRIQIYDNIGSHSKGAGMTSNAVERFGLTSIKAFFI